MRDLQKDLEEWITDHDIGKRGEWFYMTGEYIERAIKAEAEVERYKLMVKSITGGLDEAIETVHYFEKIIDGLKGDLQMVATDEWTEGFLFEKWKTLAELDKEGE